MDYKIPLFVKKAPKTNPTVLCIGKKSDTDNIDKLLNKIFRLINYHTQNDNNPNTTWDKKYIPELPEIINRYDVIIWVSATIPNSNESYTLISECFTKSTVIIFPFLSSQDKKNLSSIYNAIPKKYRTLIIFDDKKINIDKIDYSIFLFRPKVIIFTQMATYKYGNHYIKQSYPTIYNTEDLKDFKQYNSSANRSKTLDSFKKLNANNNYFSYLKKNKHKIIVDFLNNIYRIKNNGYKFIDSLAFCQLILEDLKDDEKKYFSNKIHVSLKRHFDCGYLTFFNKNGDITYPRKPHWGENFLNLKNQSRYKKISRSYYECGKEIFAPEGDYFENNNFTFLSISICKYIPKFQGSAILTSYFLIIEPLITVQGRQKKLNPYIYFLIEYFESILQIFILEDAKNQFDFKSISSAVGSIMSRNVSHNIGSHVLAASNHNLDTLPDDRFLYQYIQLRMDYVAQACTDFFPSWTQSTMFIGELIRNFLSQKRLLEHIAISEGLHCYHFYDNSLSSEKNDSQKNTIKILISKLSNNRIDSNINEKIKILHNDKYLFQIIPPIYYNKKNKKHSNNNYDFSLAIAGGVLGQHAFYTILENIIRNAAKHEWAHYNNSKTKFDNLEILVDFDDDDYDKVNFIISDNMSDIFAPLKTENDQWNKSLVIRLLLNVNRLPSNIDHVIFNNSKSCNETIEKYKSLFIELNKTIKDLTDKISKQVLSLIEMNEIFNKYNLVSSFNIDTNNQDNFDLGNIDDTALDNLYGIDTNNIAGIVSIDKTDITSIEDLDKKRIKLETDIFDLIPIEYIKQTLIIPHLSSQAELIKAKAAKKIGIPLPLHWEQQIRLFTPLIDKQSGNFYKENWGLAEMRISAGFLQQRKLPEIGGVSKNQSSTDIILPIALTEKKVDIQTNQSYSKTHLGYLFMIPKPKELLIVIQEERSKTFSNDFIINCQKKGVYFAIKKEEASNSLATKFIQLNHNGEKSEIENLNFRYVVFDILDKELYNLITEGNIKLPFRIMVQNSQITTFIPNIDFPQEYDPDSLLNIVYSTWIKHILSIFFDNNIPTNFGLLLQTQLGNNVRQNLINKHDMWKLIFINYFQYIVLSYCNNNINSTFINFLHSLTHVHISDSEINSQNDDNCIDNNIEDITIIFQYLYKLTQLIHYNNNSNETDSETIFEKYISYLKHMNNIPKVFKEKINWYIMREYLINEDIDLFINYLLQIHNLFYKIFCKNESEIETLPNILTNLPSQNDNNENNDYITFHINNDGTIKKITTDIQNTSGWIQYVRHGNIPTNNKSTTYFESLSGSQSYLNILNGIVQKYDSKDFGIIVKLIENALTRILIIDERVSNILSEHQNLKLSLRAMNIWCLDEKREKQTETDKTPDEAKLTNGEFLYFTKNIFDIILSDNKFDTKTNPLKLFQILIIHQGIIDKWLHTSHNKEKVKDFINKLNQLVPYVVITTGRGTPSNIPNNARILPFSSIQRYLFTPVPEKLLLVEAIMSTMPLGEI